MASSASILPLLPRGEERGDREEGQGENTDPPHVCITIGEDPLPATPRPVSPGIQNPRTPGTPVVSTLAHEMPGTPGTRGVDTHDHQIPGTPGVSTQDTDPAPSAQSGDPEDRHPRDTGNAPRDGGRDTLGEDPLSSPSSLGDSTSDSSLEMKPMLQNGKLEERRGSSDESSATSSEQLTFPSCAAKVEIALHPARLWMRRRTPVLIKGLFLCLYLGYVTYAAILDVERARPLVIVTSLLLIWGITSLVLNKLGGRIEAGFRRVTKPISIKLHNKWCIIKWMTLLVVLMLVVVYLVLELGNQSHQFTSLGGIFVFLFLLFIGSKHPRKVRWRPVIWGLGLQFVIAVILLRTTWGYTTFSTFGQQIQNFLSFSDYGAEFVFGPEYKQHRFAFQILPVIIYFSCVISILYHWGVMQKLIGGIAWVMEKTLSTAATESLTAASNIFVGQTEAPIIVRPFIKDMTRSELHAMMTAGFATIAGGVLAAYILFGVPAEHLLGASVMNAPAALAVSKLVYPETEESSSIGAAIKMEKGKSRNFLEAASSGASAAISLVANIAANIIAFLALLAFVNAALSWLGGLVDHPEISFQLICSYLFMPVAFLMGVEWKDCGIVAELLGTKTFLNEFVAYEKLSELIKNREACSESLRQISVRSETIVTYALCGFANLSSIGIQLGGIGPMAPSRKGDLAEMVVRALIAGTVTCFITACLAGVLVTEEPFNGCRNSTLNSTFVYLDTKLNLSSVILD